LKQWLHSSLDNLKKAEELAGCWQTVLAEYGRNAQSAINAI